MSDTSAPEQPVIGIKKIRREALVPIHMLVGRRADDGQQVRIHAASWSRPPTNHHRRWAHVDLVIPDESEHGTGLILRFERPGDVELLRGYLDQAITLLSERRAAGPGGEPA